LVGILRKDLALGLWSGLKSLAVMLLAVTVTGALLNLIL